MASSRKSRESHFDCQQVGSSRHDSSLQLFHYPSDGALIDLLLNTSAGWQILLSTYWALPQDWFKWGKPGSVWCCRQHFRQPLPSPPLWFWKCTAVSRVGMKMAPFPCFHKVGICSTLGSLEGSFHPGLRESSQRWMHFIIISLCSEKLRQSHRTLKQEASKWAIKISLVNSASSWPSALSTPSVTLGATSGTEGSGVSPVSAQPGRPEVPICL